MKLQDLLDDRVISGKQGFVVQVLVNTGSTVDLDMLLMRQRYEIGDRVILRVIVLVVNLDAVRNGTVDQSPDETVKPYTNTPGSPGRTRQLYFQVEITPFLDRVNFLGCFEMLPMFEIAELVRFGGCGIQGDEFAVDQMEKN
jgi:hypothetical protein